MRALLEGNDVPDNAPTNGEAMADYVIEHYDAMLSLYGVESGLRQARKHLGWYLDRHAPGLSQALRSAILTSLDPDEVIRTLRSAFIAAAEFEPARTAA